MGRCIVFTSGKGGVGKTSVLSHTAAALSDMGLRVAVIDTDIGLNNLDVVLGVENRVSFDLVDVINGRCRLKQALIQVKNHCSLYVLPCSQTGVRSEITSANIKLVVMELSESFDYVFIDCPAGIENGFHRAVGAASEAIVVTTPSISAIRDADKTLGILESYNLKKVGLIINRVRGDMVASNDMLSPEQIGSLLKTTPIGIIPESDDIPLLSASGDTPSRSSIAGRAFNMLAENLEYNQNRMFDCVKSYSGFWGGIRRSLKRKV